MHLEEQVPPIFPLIMQESKQGKAESYTRDKYGNSSDHFSLSLSSAQRSRSA